MATFKRDRRRRTMILLSAGLAASLLLHFVNWALSESEMPLFPMCQDGDDVVLLKGTTSKEFEDAIVTNTYFSMNVRIVDGKRKITVFRSEFFGLLGGLKGGPVLDLLSKSSADIASNIAESATGREVKHDPNNPDAYNACQRLAKWLIEPAGRDKTLDCNYLACRVLGVKKTDAKAR